MQWRKRGGIWVEPGSFFTPVPLWLKVQCRRLLISKFFHSVYIPTSPAEGPVLEAVIWVVSVAREWHGEWKVGLRSPLIRSLMDRDHPCMRDGWKPGDPINICSSELCPHRPCCMFFITFSTATVWEFHQSPPVKPCHPNTSAAERPNERLFSLIHLRSLHWSKWQHHIHKLFNSPFIWI